MPIFLIAAARLVRRLNRYRVYALLTLAATVLLAGAAAFSLTQHVSFGLALYWAVTTATTVGYGDVLPHNTAGRVVASLVMLGTIPVFGAVFALVASASVISAMRRIFGMDSSLPTSDFTVIYGTNPVLARVLEELQRAGDPVVLVASTAPAGLGEDAHFIAGDPTDETVIAHTHPERANRALIACDTDSDTLVVAVTIHSLAPQLEVFALTQSPSVARALGELGVRHTLSSDELVGHTLAKSLETPQAGDVLLSLVDSENYRMVETAVDAAFVSKPLSAARGRADVLVLGVSRNGKVELGLADDPVLGPDDRLIVLQSVA
jgi:voltage-gated potassium channel